MVNISLATQRNSTELTTKWSFGDKKRLKYWAYRKWVGHFGNCGCKHCTPRSYCKTCILFEIVQKSRFTKSNLFYPGGKMLQALHEQTSPSQFWRGHHHHHHHHHHHYHHCLWQFFNQKSNNNFFQSRKRQYTRVFLSIQYICRNNLAFLRSSIKNIAFSFH